MRVDGAYKPDYKKLAKNAYSGCQRSSMIGTEKARSIPPAIVIPEVAKPAEIRQLGKKKDRVSTPDTGQKTNGRWGIRTHDPLIKSQVLGNCKHKQEQGLRDAPDGRLQTCLQTNADSVNQVRNQASKTSSDLAEIVESWTRLPEHVRQTIVTLVASVTVTAREGDEVV